MTSSNRFWNRVVLALAAAVLLIIGSTVLAIGLYGAPDAPRPAWVEDLAAATGRAGEAVSQWTIQVAGVGTVLVAAVIAAAVMVVLIALLLVFIFTRGRGRIKDVVAVDHADGRTTIDRNVADVLLSAPLTARPDVVSVHAGAFMITRSRVIQLAIRVQPNAALDAVIVAAEHAIADWDRIVGTRIPVVIHIADRSWRDGLRPKTRVR